MDDQQAAPTRNLGVILVFSASCGPLINHESINQSQVFRLIISGAQLQSWFKVYFT